MNSNKKLIKVKRIVAIMLTAIVCFGFASCGSIDKMIDSLENAMETSGDKTRPSRDPIKKEDDSSEELIEDTDGSLFEYEKYAGGIAIKKYIGTDSTVKIPEEIDGKTVLAVNSNAITDYEVDGKKVSIKEIIIPTTVVEIERSAFAGCKSLLKYTAPFVGGSVDEHAYFGYVFGATSTESNSNYVPLSLETAHLGGQTVADGAFRGCQALKNVILTDVTSVGDSAFYGCTMLKTVIMPDTVTSLGNNIFDKCTSLYELKIPYLGNGSENLYLGYIFGAKDYKENVDYVPTSLRKLTVACGENVPAYAFYECLYLTEITIVDSPVSVGEYAFYLCKKMHTLSIGDSNYAGIETINGHSFAYCGALAKIKLSPALSVIPSYGFYGCSSLRIISMGDTENVLPATVTVGEYSFGYCAGIMEMQLPETMTSIPKGLFYGCTSLRKISIPAGVTSIEAEAFKGCSALTNVEFAADSKVETIGESAFSYCSSLRGVDTDPSEDSTLYVFSLPDSIKSIGEYAFAYCEYLSRIKLPVNINAIPDYCFFGCSALNNVKFGKADNTLGESVWNIGSGAFYGCSAMEELSISENVNVIGKDAFDSCDVLVFHVKNGSEIHNWLIENGVGSSRLVISN